MVSKTSLLVATVCVVGLVIGQHAAAQEHSTVAISLVSAATTVSDRFQRETEAASRSVPPQVWKTLDEAGWRVQLAEFVVDAAPSLRGVRPNGWPRDLTWDNSDAIHLPNAKLLVVAEKRRNRAGDIVDSSRVAGVLRHEIGHAFDMAAGQSGPHLSDSTQFVSAYQQDSRYIAAADRRSLVYYLQDSRVGRQETFAESFAVVLGGGSSDIKPAEFESHFPRVTAYTRAMIAKPVAARVAELSPTSVSKTTSRRQSVRRR